MLAKLTISHPGLAFLVGFEGEGVDQYRLSVVELNIVSVAIFRRHPHFKRQGLDLQSYQGSIFELAEAPFIGIGDKIYSFRLDDFIRYLRNRGWNIHFYMRDYQVALNKLGIQSGLDPQIIISLTMTINLPVQST